MYKEFYGLSKNPFDMTPDPEFFFWSQKHQDAYRHLVYSVHNKRGLTVLTGEIGTGKTTILNSVIEYFRETDKGVKIAFIVNSKITTNDLLNLVFDEYEIGANSSNKGEKLIALKNFLTRSYTDGDKIILILDEAQNFSHDLLEEIRLLSNIETPKEKLIQIILAGQPQLLEKLHSPTLNQLKQRVGIIYHLQPLNLLETKHYIGNRLNIAGAEGRAIFSPAGVEEIFRYAQGVPRLINIICDNALLFGYSSKAYEVGEDIIKQVAVCLDPNILEEEEKISRARENKSREERADNIVSKQIEDYISQTAYDSSNKRTKGLVKYILLSSIFLIFIFILYFLLSEGFISVAQNRKISQYIRNISHSMDSVEEGHSQQSNGNPYFSSPVQREMEKNELGDSKQLNTVSAGETQTPRTNRSTTPVPEYTAEKREYQGIRKSVTVRPGDTLAGIILREYGEYNENILNLVKKANPKINNINMIDRGQIILLPEL